MRKDIPALLLGLLLSGTVLSARESDAIRLYQVDPLHKVLKENTYLVDDVDTARVARGGYATLQIVAKAFDDVTGLSVQVGEIRSASGTRLDHASAGWVGYVNIGRRYANPSSDVLRSPSGYFPDPVLPDSLFTVSSGEVQPLWITVPVDTEAVPGLYRGTVEVSGRIGKKTSRWQKEFFIRVYPVTLGPSPLLFTNWSVHDNPLIRQWMNGGKPVELGSDTYWDLLKMNARMMVEHRQNVFRVFPSWLTLYTFDGERYTFDFSRFDREVGIYESCGPVALIEGGHLAWRHGAWASEFLVEVPLPDDAESQALPPGARAMRVENGMRFVKLPVSDSRAQRFLSQFLPALCEHLRAKGWLEKYVQHIGDEPVAANSASYAEISGYVRRYMPGVRIIEAVMTSQELAGTIDIWVPQLSILDKDYSFYKELQDNGKEVWYYVCTSPRGNYANRFIELPLIQVRYLHWINYKYGVPGFLHWGLNSWGDPDPLRASASRDQGRYPAGDHCVIYPGRGRLYTSIRFDAERDGVDDYQLLKMLEEKDPKAARNLVDNIILGFNRYDGSISWFRKMHRSLLEQLSSDGPK